MKKILLRALLGNSVACSYVHADVMIRAIENNSNSNVYVGYSPEVSPEPDLVIFTQFVQVAKNKTVNANLSILSRDKLKVIGVKRFAFLGRDLDKIANTPLRLRINADHSVDVLP